MKLKDLTEYFQENLYEMSTFLDRNTGLDTGTKLWVREEPRGLPHSKYRIKISHPQKGSAVFAIWGDDAIQLEGNWKVEGKDLTKLQKLVALMRGQIRNHIDGVIDSRELGNDLFTIKSQVEQA